MSQPTATTPRIGVLVVEYGEPATLEEVEPYVRGHFGGQAPPAEYVASLQEQFRRVWGADCGVSGARWIFTALDAELAQQRDPAFRAALGARYWHPSIEAALADLAREGSVDVVVLPLNPFVSKMAMRSYRHALEQACAAVSPTPRIHLIESWPDLPGFIATVTANAGAALARFPVDARDQVVGLFIAHSVAESTRKSEDVYRQQLEASSARLAAAIGLAGWRCAFYSAEGPGQWLGPDVLEAIDQLHQAGVRQILAIPIAAAYDNVELLYELDVRMAERAAALGITYERPAVPNAAPAMIADLASLVAATARTALTA